MQLDFSWQKVPWSSRKCRLHVKFRDPIIVSMHVKHAIKFSRTNEKWKLQKGPKIGDSNRKGKFSSNHNFKCFMIFMSMTRNYFEKNPPNCRCNYNYSR